MQNILFTVDAVNNKSRLDRFITEKLRVLHEQSHCETNSAKVQCRITQYSRNEVQHIIGDGLASVNETVIRDNSYKLHTGQSVTINFTHTANTVHPKDQLSSLVSATSMNLTIVYEDEYLAIIDKPAGLVVHPGAGHTHDTLANGLLALYGETLTTDLCHTQMHRPGIVHRLDKDTSGLILVAKSSDVTLALSDMISKRTIKRTYSAIVHGIPTPITAKIVTKIAKSRGDHTKMTVSEIRGKVAITVYTLVKKFVTQAPTTRHSHSAQSGMFSLLECELETGRTHQIRVHLRFHGNPIVGDKKYSMDYNFNHSALPPELSAYLENFPRQALHARRLRFTHPITAKIIDIESDLPHDMQELMEKLLACQ